MLIHGEPLNPGPQVTAPLYGIDIFTDDYFVLSQSMHLTDI